MSENELLDVGGGGRFRVGSMLRVGGEVREVIAVEADTLTVRRPSWWTRLWWSRPVVWLRTAWLGLRGRPLTLRVRWSRWR